MGRSPAGWLHPGHVCDRDCDAGQALRGRARHSGYAGLAGDMGNGLLYIVSRVPAWALTR